MDMLMAVQERVSLGVNESKIGQHLSVIIDREDADYYVGRTQYDSPEVDPEVLISKDIPLNKGEIYNVIITQAEPFDLYGNIVVPN